MTAGGGAAATHDLGRARGGWRVAAPAEHHVAVDQGHGDPREVAADIVLCDAPIGSGASTALDALARGDLPGISMALIDGDVMLGRSRNTPPAARAAEIVGGGGPTAGGH